ncbi:MAG: PEP-CTERM sorting domain-containing protein [Limisphaerales bacterium]
MKKNRYIRLAAALCVAGLSTCMLSSAKAGSSAFSTDTLSLLQNDAQVVAPVTASPVNGFEAGPVSQVAFSGNTSLPVNSSFPPVQSFDPVISYSVIPEPATTSCLLLGLGVLLVFKRLKIGRANLE